MQNSIRTIALTLFVVGAGLFSLGTIGTGLSMCSDVAQCLSAVALYQVDFNAPTADSSPMFPAVHASESATYFDTQVASEMAWLTGLYMTVVAGVIIIFIEMTDPTLFGRAPKRRKHRVSHA